MFQVLVDWQKPDSAAVHTLRLGRPKPTHAEADALGRRFVAAVRKFASYRVILARGAHGIEPTSPTGINPDHVTVTQDQVGRTVVVVPDVDALYLADQVREGWTELLGQADGYSRTFGPGTWVHASTAVILAAVAASDTVDGLDRLSAAEGWVIAAVVGQSGWDPATAWWRDHLHTRHLHPSGYPGRVHGTDTYVWRG